MVDFRERLKWVTSGEWELIKIPIDKIKGISKFNVRQIAPEMEIDILAKSLKVSGINIVPVVLDENNEVIAGGRRYMAAKHAGLKELFAIRKPMNEKEKLVYSMIENVVRLDLHPEDKFDFALKMRRRGFNVTEIAEILGVHRLTVTEWLKWHDIPPILQETEEGARRYQQLSQRTRKKVRPLLKKEPFKEDVDSAVKLMKVAEKGPTREVEQIQKEANLGLYPNMDFHEEIAEHEEEYSLHHIRFHRDLERRLVKVFRYMGCGFSDGVVALLEEVLPEKEKELGIVPVDNEEQEEH